MDHANEGKPANVEKVTQLDSSGPDLSHLCIWCLKPMCEGDAGVFGYDPETGKPRLWWHAECFKEGVRPFSANDDRTDASGSAPGD